MKKLITEDQKRQLKSLGLDALTIEKKYTIVDELPPEEPRKLAPIPRKEQLRQRLAVGLLTESEFKELQILNEKSEAEAEERALLDQPLQRAAAGLIDGSQCLRELAEAREEVQRGKKLLVEQPKTKADAKKLIWERQERGELSIESAALACVAIEKVWDAPTAAKTKKTEFSGPTWMDRRRYLTEKKQCSDDCDCRECHIEGFREKLDEQVRLGRISKQKADACYQMRCSL